jgi:hypothetical protein
MPAALRLTLPLLVARIGADDVDDALAPHDLTMFTNSLDAGANLHGTRPIGPKDKVESD